MIVRLHFCPFRADKRRTGHALVGVLIWGASRRLAALTEVGWAPLDPDAITYMQLAAQMTSPYDTGSREPMWIWVIKGWFLLVGASPWHLRILTVLLSLVLIGTAFKVFGDYTERPLVGLFSALLLSGSPYLIQLSVRGLREEAYLVAILCLIWLAFVPRGRRLGWESLGLAVAGTAVQLLRFNSYVFVAPVLLWWSWKRASGQWALRAFLLLFMVGASIPHLIHNAQTFGDPMYSVNVHFVWARNYEFVLMKETGCEECPTRESVLVDSTLGPTINGFHYLFGLHSPGEVVWLTAHGYLDAYLRPGHLFEIQSGTRSLAGYACYLLGLVLVLAGPYRSMLAIMLLMANVVPFALALDIDPRIAIQTAPFVAFITAYGAARGIEGAGLLLEQVSLPRAVFGGAAPVHGRGGLP